MAGGSPFTRTLKSKLKVRSEAFNGILSHINIITSFLKAVNIRFTRLKRLEKDITESLKEKTLSESEIQALILKLMFIRKDSLPVNKRKQTKEPTQIILELINKLNNALNI